MSALGVIVLLAVIHTTIVATMTLIVRLCVPRRLPAGRATVGVVGMSCVLALSVMAICPIPGVWPGRRAPAAVSIGAVSHAGDPQSPERDRSDVGLTAAQSASSAASEVETANIGLRLPRRWLQRLEDRMEQVTIAADAPSRGWRSALLAVLLAAMTISVVRLSVATRAVRRLRKASRRIEDSLIAETVERCRRRCGCRQEIEVCESNQIMTAAACGWLKPVILLPSEWPEWSDEELQAVLAHEVAHVCRADYIQRLVALLGAAVYFYHPLVKAAVRRLAIDQELAADRLARGMASSGRAYARGLARLALRYDDALQDRRTWSSVSIMPRSSDFLARRLEMLRDENDDRIERPSTRLIPYGAVACLVAAALATTLLRGAAAADEKGDRPAAGATRPVEKTARLPNVDGAFDGPQAEAKPAGELFRREAFDPAMIRPGSHGAFLIRVGEMTRHPELQSHLDALNKGVTEFVQETISEFKGEIDLSDIEWVAADLILTVKGPVRKDDTQTRLMLGSGGMVIRLARGGASADGLLKAVPGSLLKKYEGKNYVQFPAMPAIGPVPVRVRIADEKTYVLALGTREDVRPVEAEAKLLKRFFDDTPQQHDWAKDWKAVDGGLITVLFDNSKAGWLELPKDNPEYSATLAPLFEKTRYVAVGFDWTEQGNRTGVQVRATCADQAAVKEVQLAAMSALAYWPALLLEAGEPAAKYHKRILQLFSTLKVQPSAAGVDAHFVEATANVSWDPQEFVDVLRNLFN